MDTQNVQTEEREKRHLSVKEICEIIPHRHPFLLVDYIEDYHRILEHRGVPFSTDARR